MRKTASWNHAIDRSRFRAEQFPCEKFPRHWREGHREGAIPSALGAIGETGESTAQIVGPIMLEHHAPLSARRSEIGIPTAFRARESDAPTALRWATIDQGRHNGAMARCRRATTFNRGRERNVGRRSATGDWPAVIAKFLPAHRSGSLRRDVRRAGKAVALTRSPARPARLHRCRGDGRVRAEW